MTITFEQPASPPAHAPYTVKMGDHHMFHICVSVEDGLGVMLTVYNGDDQNHMLELRVLDDNVFSSFDYGQNIAWHIGINTADCELFAYWVHRIAISAWDTKIPRPELFAITK